MSITNPLAVHMVVPDYRIDNIIGICTGSFTIAAPTSLEGTSTAIKAFTTGFSDTCLFQGIFSVDGGSSWNDLGVYRPNLSTPGEPVLQTVTCRGYVSTGGIFTAVGLNWYDNVHNTSQSYTIDYKIAFMAKDDQASVIPIATTEKIQYESSYNYQKIYLSGTFASTTGTPVDHNLNYVPKVRGWFSPNSATYGSEGVYQIPANCLTTLDWFSANIKVSTTAANFTEVQDNNGQLDGTMYYRIYLDS